MFNAFQEVGRNAKLSIINVIVYILCIVACQTPVTNADEANGYVFRDTTLPIDKRVEDLVSRLTLEEKISLLWEIAEPIERLGVSKYYHGNEALHGVVRPGPFTVFPQAIAFGATFNPDLIEKVATAISDEARAKWAELDFGAAQTQFHSDLLTFWSPNINMARDPRWGRTAGTYGEDPWLTSRIGVAFVKGLQGNDDKYVKVVSTPKHFVANNVEENRFSANSVISEKTLREYYLPAFKATIVEGKAQSIMSAYNAVNYVPSNASRWLLTDLLRDEWGFEGYVVSDCGGPRHLRDSFGWVKDYSDAAAISIRAGMDLECNGGKQVIQEHLLEAVEQGKITEAEIDVATTRVLRSRFRLGLFDPVDMVPYNKLPPKTVGSQKHRELAAETARQSMVLLENKDNTLPLDERKIRKIAVVGHNADIAVFGDYSGAPSYEPISPLMGLQERLEGKVEIDFASTSLALDNYSLVPARYLSHHGGEAGLKGEYFYGNKTLAGHATSRVDAQVDLHTIDNPPDPMFQDGIKSVRWTGKLTVPEGFTRRLGAKSDDGVRIWLDDELVIDQWVDQGETLSEARHPLEANRTYDIKIEYYDGGGAAVAKLMWSVPPTQKNDFTRQVAAAESADVVIAVIGTNTNTEAEGTDKTDLDLPGNQLRMLKEVHAANDNVIVVLVTGSQHSIGWIKENAKAVLNAWYPGEQGGRAIADVLFGDVSPAGRSPLTYYESAETLPDMERYEISEGRTYQYYEGQPLWVFGHGLSYTEFDYANAAVRSTRHGYAELSLDVSNVGERDGDEVVQVYASFPNSRTQRPIKKLVGFERLAVKAGETQKAEIRIRYDQLAFWSALERDWQLEDTPISLSIGASSADIRQTVTLIIPDRHRVLSK